MSESEMSYTFVVEVIGAVMIVLGIIFIPISFISRRRTYGLIYDIMKRSSEKSIPVDKKCITCKKKKLLTEFEVNESEKDRHNTVCKTCASNEPVYGACCQYHFEQMMIANIYTQFQLQLQLIEALQDNEAEIPPNLLEKMYRVAHKGGIRCRYDSCDYDKEKQMKS